MQGTPGDAPPTRAGSSDSLPGSEGAREQRNLDLSFLLSASHQMVGSLSLPELLERISRSLLEVVPASRIGILLQEGGDESRVRLAAAASQGMSAERSDLPAGRLLDLADYPEVREALKSRAEVDIADVSQSELLAPVRENLLTAGIRSLLVIPLLEGEDCLGVFSLVQFGDDVGFSQRERNLVQAVANQAAVAIRNAQLFAELRSSARELEMKVAERTRRLADSHLRLSVLNDITTAINLALERPLLLERSIANLQRLRGFDRVQVYLGDQSAPGTFELHELSGQGKPRHAVVDLPDPTDVGEVAVLQLAGVPVEAPGLPPHGFGTAHSHLVAPLVSKSGVIGALQSFSRDPSAYGSADLDLLQQVAGEVSIALERSRLQASEARRGRQFEVVSDIGRELTSAVAGEDLLSFAAELIRTRLEYSMVALLAVEGDELAVVGASSAEPRHAFSMRGHRQMLDEGLAGQALVTREPILVDDVATAERYVTVEGLPTRSELAVPIRVRGETMGVLDLQSELPRAFGENDVAVARTLADQLAAAIQLRSVFEDLEEERLFSSHIIDNLTGGLIVTDRHRAVQIINARGAEMLRVDPADLDGMDLLVPFPTAAPLFQFSPDTLSRECAILLQDATQIPIGFSNAFFVDSSGDRSAIIITFRDLSEVRELQKKVRSAERLATIGTVAAGVAHEIRNPLFGISATAQVLEQELRSDTALGELCSSMLEETRRLDRLVQSLLTYGRPRELVTRPVQLGSLIEDCVAACAGQATEAEVTVKTVLPSGELVMELDHDQIKQVFLNLLLNAFDAAPKSTVTVVVESDPEADHVLVAVEDQGEGLTPADSEKIFDLFYTTKGSGSGMGLAISRKIAEDHAGSLGVSCTPGEGARFELRLPKPRGPEVPEDAPS